MTGVAHGKVIWLGEHAVVHGMAALAGALPLEVRIDFERCDGPARLELPGVGLAAGLGDGSRLGEALTRLVEAVGAPRQGFRLLGSCDVPLGGGLGSSAAIAAAAARALSEGLGLELSDPALFQAVQSSEAVFHGNPSGIDAAVALFGGALRFSRAQGVERLLAPMPRLSVVASGEPKDTKIAVERFTAKLHASQQAGETRLRRIGVLVDVGGAALERGDLVTLGEAMNENHELLRWFGVSTPLLDNLCELARRSGALGAKLTGAGCGGAAIVLTRPGDNAPVEALRRASFEVIAS